MKKPRPITAYAVVDKKKPIIFSTDLYSKKQIKEIRLNKDEVVIAVRIHP